LYRRSIQATAGGGDDGAMHATHPLDPLTPSEIAHAVEVIRRDCGLSGSLRFTLIDLREPDKADLLGWAGGAASRPAREAEAVVLDNGDGLAYEAVVDLDQGAVTSWTNVPGVQPVITADEGAEAERIVRADPRFAEALRRRGIDDPATAMVDAWAPGDHEHASVRCSRGLVWVLADTEGDNGYARPVGGLVVVIDLNAMEVLRIDDHFVLPVPDGEGGDYRDAGGGEYRTDIRPLEITQPEGPSFSLDGRLLRWQKWQMRVGFTAREGLVLHDIAYQDGDELRRVCHRASIVELVVPYGDPNPTVHFKSTFDVGEHGLGALVNRLELGCDCLGEIRYLDGAVVSSRGDALELPNAICIHEEDIGILWKHFDWRSGRTDLARGRRLVVSCIATVGNYEYGLFWYFQQDGTIEFEAKLTGVLHTAGVPVGEPQANATLVAPGVAASYHQHFFCARLDMDVDGGENSVLEVEAQRDPVGPQNPDGIAFSSRTTVLRSEREARRNVDPSVARKWRVVNPARHNAMGTPVSYELMPGINVLPMQDEGSRVRRRAGMINHHLWVTPYRRDERFPAGEYPNQHAGGDGLPAWTEQDRPLEETDVVLWYTFGEHHVPRLEDWPVMPVVRLGFHLRPVNFFDRNPALDVPRPAAHCHH
jgi:primary-amine oxidase